MFNERIDIYGGMSQEIRTRLNRQGWKFEYCENAKATQKMSSHNRDKKQDIMRAKIKLFKMGL
jgi:GT2 family glycosyltransferase